MRSEAEFGIASSWLSNSHDNVVNKDDCAATCRSSVMITLGLHRASPGVHGKSQSSMKSISTERIESDCTGVARAPVRVKYESSGEVRICSAGFQCILPKPVGPSSHSIKSMPSKVLIPFGSSMTIVNVCSMPGMR